MAEINLFLRYNNIMGLIKVGVLRGGPSLEYEISLKTGKTVLLNLPETYSGKDIFISKEGDWYLDRRPSDPERVFRSVDVIFNALHGQYGEDGKVQQLLEHFGMPYTGSGVVASALGMNKVLAREEFKKTGLKAPRAVVADADDGSLKEAGRIFKTISPPWIVKPISGGSSVGVSVAMSLPDLTDALDAAFDSGQKVLVEEYIIGKEATCGIIDDFREEKYYALPVIEIIPPLKFGFFNYDAKYSGETKEICPAGFSLSVKKGIENMARKAHNALGCRHYSRSDFIIAPPRKRNEPPLVYILEINTLPGLTEESLVPKALHAVGASYGEFLDHLINLALKR